METQSPKMVAVESMPPALAPVSLPAPLALASVPPSTMQDQLRKLRLWTELLGRADGNRRARLLAVDRICVAADECGRLVDEVE